jgi:hypothetical protein
VVFYKQVFCFLVLAILFHSCDRDKSVFEVKKQNKFKKFNILKKDITSCTPTENLSQADCQKYEICVPVDKDKGICKIDCTGIKDGEKIKLHEACPKDYRCMQFRDPFLSPTGYFCEKPESKRDMPCNAAFDDDACLGGQCVPTLAFEIKPERPIFLFNRCKRECLNSCPDNEQCLQVGFGKKDFGQCGKAIPIASLKDFRGKNYLGENCNERFDHRYCEKLSGLDSECTKLAKTGEGICLVPCFDPSRDLKEKICPEGFSCKIDIAHKIEKPTLIKKQGQNIACDEKLCPENAPCQECGEHATCLADKTGHFCSSYRKTCVAD